MITSGQRMEIQDLTNNHGLLTMKLGTARTIKTYKNLIHIIRLEKYDENIKTIGDSLKIFEKINGYNDTLNVIKVKYEQVQAKLQTLTPKFRQKRGLINGLGTVVKSITGNMDADDALYINTKIEKLLQRQNDIEQQENNQDKLNEQMIERFDNITNHINVQQRLIENYLINTEKTLGNRIRSEENSIRYIQYLNQINFNIEFLNNHLSDISECIILAKLNIISKHILNADELTFIYDYFKNQAVDIKSDEHIYELLKLQAYYNHSNIIFNIQIPSLKEEISSFFHLIPFPFNNKLLLTKPFCTLSNNETRYFDQKCEQIETVFYCKEEISQDANTEERCITNLIKNKPAECKTIDVSEEHQIYQPEPNYILLVNIPGTEVKSTCGPEKQTIEGTLIIHFTNCSVEINQIIYENRNNIFLEEIHIYPLSFNKMKTSSSNKVNLQTLQNFHFENKKAIRHLDSSDQRTLLDYTTITAVFVFIIVVYLVKNLKPKDQLVSAPDILDNNLQHPAFNIMLAPAKDDYNLFDRTSLQGGRSYIPHNTPALVPVFNTSCNPGH